MSTATIAPEINGLKAKLKETWSAGDYDYFSRYMERGAQTFYERLDVPSGCQLLDVGCGSGQLALWAARDGVNVTGVDIAPNLVRRAQARANAEGLKTRFTEGDAEALPFEESTEIGNLLGGKGTLRLLVRILILRIATPARIPGR